MYNLTVNFLKRSGRKGSKPSVSIYSESIPRRDEILAIEGEVYRICDIIYNVNENNDNNNMLCIDAIDVNVVKSVDGVF